MKALFVCILLLLIFAASAAAETEMHAVSVGKGDAIIIRAEGCTALIDTGKGYACGRLRRAFEELGITHLDAVFITHVDSDHIEGLNFLAESGIEVDKWYASPYFFEYKEKKHPIRKIDQEPTWLYAGDEVVIGSARFSVLAPLTKNEDEENDNSLVMMLETADGRILLTGDMEYAEEAELLATDADLRCSILKVSNHGDGDATSDAFIDRACAEYAIISTDSYEKPDTPDPGVMAALRSAAVQVLVTQDSDVIKCVMDSGNVSAEHVFWEGLPVYENISMTVDKGDELFTIANGSGADISLKNWYIYSESGNELYIFGDITVPAGGDIVLGTKTSEGTYDAYWDEKNVISNKKEDALSLYDENGRLICVVN